MADFADQFGEWTTLGIVEPSTLDWIAFLGNAKNSEVFRLNFDTNWGQWEQEAKYRFRSSGLLEEEYRPLGLGNSESTTTPNSRRIVPQRSSLFLKIDPLPFDYDNGVERRLKIKRYYPRSPQNWELTQPALDIPWKIKIEAMEPNY